MLEQLGIPASAEIVLPTLTASSTGSFTCAALGERPLPTAPPVDIYLPDQTNPFATANLAFDFGGSEPNPNRWEGGVKVEGQFYPEGNGEQSYCMVVGVAQSGQTAEYNAMLQIATNIYGANPNYFQHYWARVTATGQQFWLDGISGVDPSTAYVPFTQ
jgi:hypothetical protein